MASNCGQAGSTCPVSAFSPVGRSRARSLGDFRNPRTRCKCRIASPTGPASGRERPVPSTASMTRLDRRNIRSSMSVSDPKTTSTPYSTASFSLGSCSGRRVTRQQTTSAPQRRRCRAATSPSAPLLPGPTSTTIRAPAAPPNSARAARATARPAFSINVSVLTPARSDACSMAAICAAVTTFTAIAACRRAPLRLRPEAGVDVVDSQQILYPLPLL